MASVIQPQKEGVWKVYGKVEAGLTEKIGKTGLVTQEGSRNGNASLHAEVT